MTSRKRSARAKQVAEFKANLGGLDDVFENEQRRLDEQVQAKEAALRDKACESKNRYASRTEAEETVRWCAAHGKTGLSIYRCPYCDGWHLTSKPQRR